MISPQNLQVNYTLESSTYFITIDSMYWLPICYTPRNLFKVSFEQEDSLTLSKFK